ncbi:MAG TPA: peptidoglycan editing factor PgeF [Terriglobales bacterium]
MPRQAHSSQRVARKTNVLRAENLTPRRWLIHAFSTRQGGVSTAYGGNALNLGFTQDDDRSLVERNRVAFLSKLGVSNRRSLTTLRQVHSDVIHHVERASERRLTGDGLITGRPGILLAVQTADCLPVILVDTRLRAVGVFHAGWRGTLQRIVEKGVGEMRKRFGTRPGDLQASIGPGIRSCCFEVGEELRAKFESQFAYAAKLFREVQESDPVRDKYPLLFLSARPPGHSNLPRRLFLDLAEANRRQLRDAGVSARNITQLQLCTACRTDLLFSHRAEKGHTGRMMAVVGIRKP